MMSPSTNDADPAFQGAGAKHGIQIWCVEKLRLVPVPKSLHGKFYCGNAYIVLNTVSTKSGLYQHDIHYWLGKDANQVESAFASDKALELDFALGSCTVQYREAQGEETEKFLSYFKPCVIPIEGVYSSQPGRLHGDTYKVSLFTCKGEHVVSVKEVPFYRSSLNHNDVFILDSASKIFLFSGYNSSIQERAKALEVVQYIKENKHGGNCEVAIIEDGKFVGDADVGEFWSLFGGYAPIPKDAVSGTQKQSENPSVQLFWITTQGKLCPSQSDSFNKDMLDTNKCYMLDSGAEVFVWMGRNTSITERKMSISTVEDSLRSQGRSTATKLAFITEGLETPVFRSYFENWPLIVETKLYEEGRGKVAAIFKQQGYDVKELPDVELFQPHINCRGKLKVWLLNCDQLVLISGLEHIQLYGGDCYIIQYTYPGDARDENLFYSWLGRSSVKEDRVDVISHMIALADLAKGNTVLAQVMQDKEPPLFFMILQRLIIFKGGLSKQYKNFIAEKSNLDETYDGYKTALFQVEGTSPENMQAKQVDQVASSLNSSCCYILQIGESIFTWKGNLSSTLDHDLLDRMTELINPMWQPVNLREGNEPDIFWKALGGKTDYPREKEIKQHIEDPHMFKLTFSDGDFKVKEIYNFSQEDLTTEDILVLDCHVEIYVWIGCHSSVNSKQQAFTLGSKFLQVEGLSVETPVYVIAEGSEPPFFTCFFEWDSSKANMHGNSFERKLAALKGNKQNLEAHKRNLRKASSRETTPDGLRSKSVSSTRGHSSLSSASTVSDSNFSSCNNQLYSSPSPTGRKLFPGSPYDDSAGSPVAEASSLSQNAKSFHVNGSDGNLNSPVYPYEQLKINSTNPVKGIDVTKREAYLHDEEFKEKFGMTRSAFCGLPKWKQNKLKMSLDLF